MSVLVITPTLGRSPWLAETVADVAALRASVPLRHVLVAPADLVGELQRRWPEVGVRAESAGGGVYGAINEAATDGDWRWMTWINDDDRLRAGCAELWRCAEQFPERADVWYGDVDYLDEAGATLAKLPIARRGSQVPALLASGVAPFTQQGTLLARDSWLRLGGLAPAWRIAGDFDLWVRAAAAGMRFEYVPRTVGAFRIRAGQLSGDVARAQIEIREILARRELTVGGAKRWISLARFRMANLPRILRRMLRTGRARSVAAFAR